MPLSATGLDAGAARRPEPKFLSGWVLLAAAPFGLVQALVTVSASGGSTDGAIGRGMGRALGGIVAAALVAWVPWRLARRPRYLAPVVFVTMYAMMTLSAVSASFGMTQGGGGAPGATPSARDTQMKLKAASDSWAAAGAFDMKDVKTPADIARRIERLDALVRVIHETHGPASAAGGQLEAGRQIGAATEEILTPGRQQLVMLQQEWGHWAYDSTTNAVRFHDPKVDARFRRHVADFTAAQARLDGVVRRLNVPPPR